MTCPIPPIQRKKPMCKPNPLIRQSRGPLEYQHVLDAYGTEVKPKEMYSTAQKYYDKFSDDNYKLNITEPYATTNGYYKKLADANYKINLEEPYGRRFTLYEPFGQGLACLENRKTAIAPCSSKYIICKNGTLFLADCPNGQFFNTATSTCSDKTSISLC